MSWLVTGGAGYIGSHVVRAFAAEDIAPVVIDDLSSGHREFVRPDVPFYRGNVGNEDLLRHIFAGHQIRGVVHLAGFKYAGVSVRRPLHTYTENVTGMVALLQRDGRSARSTRSSSPPAPPSSAPPTSISSPSRRRPDPNPRTGSRS